MNCTITSLDKTEYFEDLISIILPGFWGELEILPGHAESFILLKKGKIILRSHQGEKYTFPVLSGGCHIKDDEVFIVL